VFGGFGKGGEVCIDPSDDSIRVHLIDFDAYGLRTTVVHRRIEEIVIGDCFVVFGDPSTDRHPPTMFADVCMIYPKTAAGFSGAAAQ
jgi:hypothetical protein